MTFLCLYISRWWRQTWDTASYFTVVNQSQAIISTEHGTSIYIYIYIYIQWEYFSLWSHIPNAIDMEWVELKSGSGIFKYRLCLPIMAEWLQMASLILINSVSYNGFAWRHQSVTWAKANYCQLDLSEQSCVSFELKHSSFHSQKLICKCRLVAILPWPLNIN